MGIIILHYIALCPSLSLLLLSLALVMISGPLEKARGTMVLGVHSMLSATDCGSKQVGGGGGGLLTA